MRAYGQPEAEVMREVELQMADDVPWERVVNSICSSPLTIGVKAFLKGIETNLGDPRIFRGTTALEARVIHLLGSLLDCPRATGNVVSGGTEANLLALLNARSLRGIPGQPEIVLSPASHFSLLKAIALLGWKPVFAEMDARFRIIPESVASLVNQNTALLVCTAGTSEYGSIDSLDELARVADAAGIPLHVDAATGGFIIPFARRLGRPLPKLSFDLPAVASITLDPHKYGLAPIPAGCILFRPDLAGRPHLVESFFVGTPAHSTFVGTRPGAAVVAVFAILEHLGVSGFEAITAENFANTDYLVDRLSAIGVELHTSPELNIVCARIEHAKRVMDRLEHMGWIASCSKRRDDLLRLVVTRHVTRDVIDGFVNALEASMRLPPEASA